MNKYNIKNNNIMVYRNNSNNNSISCGEEDIPIMEHDVPVNMLNMLTQQQDVGLFSLYGNTNMNGYCQDDDTEGFRPYHHGVFLEDEDEIDSSSGGPLHLNGSTSVATRHAAKTASLMQPYQESDEEEDSLNVTGATSRTGVEDATSNHHSFQIPPSRAQVNGYFFPASEDDTEAEVTEVCVEDLGPPGKEIGHGGDRGSCVYRLDLQYPEKYCTSLRGIVAEADACKLYPRRISDNELMFIKTIYKDRYLRKNIIATNSPNTRHAKDFMFTSSTSVEERGARHLVLPAAVVVTGGVRKGLLMPRYNCSLKQFLISLTTREENFEEVCSPFDSFLTRQRYAPVASIQVVTAIAYQVLEALVLLNHHMKHTVDGVCYSGFSHNDLHMDNILLSKTGRVALCDFELVEHIPVRTHHPEHSNERWNRLPPYSRQSPHGLFTPLSDTWAFGLIIINLLTGVDPLFCNKKLMDDLFGEGPLLLKYNSPSRNTAVPVVDWEANVEQHAHLLLDRVDDSGALKHDAFELLRVCSKCLVNREGANPQSARQLLDDDVFAKFRQCPRYAEDIVAEWVVAECAKLPLATIIDS